MNSSSFDQPTTSLPKTTEGALVRYRNAYMQYFKGDKREMTRLIELASGSVFQLRKIAPNFYEHKLPSLINQAASGLLSVDWSREDAELTFNIKHKFFMLVLDNLKKAQPAGEVIYQKECEMVMEYESLKQRRKNLNHEINVLESTEVNLENDDFDGLVTLIDDKKHELRVIEAKISKMEGDDLTSDIRVTLDAGEGSRLSRLSGDELQELEDVLSDYLRESLEDKPIEPGQLTALLSKANIDTQRFPTSFDQNELTYEINQSVRASFREAEQEARSRYHTELLSNNFLLPREGLIFESPDDLDEAVLKELDEHQRDADMRRERIKREFISRQDEDEHQNPGRVDMGDAISDEDEQDDEELARLTRAREESLRHLNESLQANPDFFRRVKEEPRDDYDVDLDMETEGSHPTNQPVVRPQNGVHKEEEEDDDDDVVILN